MLRRDLLLSAVSCYAVFASETQPDPWPPADLIEPDSFAKQLPSKPDKLLVICVGFPVLYRAAHITGAVLAGPCSKPQGLTDLRKFAANLPHDRQIVLYCGCCPFAQCPNIRPAYTALHSMPFANLKVLHLPTNLHTDWILKGYPVEKNL
ncbi:MAG: rhodanese-like domain-containing protein [Acidobacteriota bacterium]|nr:rhodanese-like domain-containing protein [Acidobacteriota bacterium]